MIHLFEILILFLCFSIVFLFHKKVSSNPENKTIAIFSTTIATISIITLAIGYSWFFYSHNIDWSLMYPQWQEVNTKDWNDVNYIEGEIGGSIWLVASLTNPIVAFLAFYISMASSMTGDPQPINQMHALRGLVIPVLLSLLTYLSLSNILARVIRKIIRGKKGQFIVVSLIALMVIAFIIFLFFRRLI